MRYEIRRKDYTNDVFYEVFMFDTTRRKYTRILTTKDLDTALNEIRIRMG